MRLERGRLYRQLRKLNLTQPYSSGANFMLCSVLRGQASTIQKHLQEDGILVKPIADKWLPNHLRIGVGKPDDTSALIASLRKLAGQFEI
jgi:histidinol-phosphate aminotransferase